MTDESPPSISHSKKKKTKKSVLRRAAEPSSLDGLQWSESLPSDDPFSHLGSSGEGGFLSLEEIDESEYCLIGGLPEPVTGAKKPKKRKRGATTGDGGSGEDSCVTQTSDEEEEKETAEKMKKKKKKKKKRKNKKKVKENTGGEPEEQMVVDVIPTDSTPALENEQENSCAEIDVNDDSIMIGYDDNNDDEDNEFNAWKELRLHPILLKSIRRLGFKEPTPIQKACIPAAAHQGKDIVGAAETGSGKTLAFGLPILQRLLEEQDKDSRMLQKGKNMADKGEQEGPLRALIVTPTRELALQVCDHLKEASKLTNIRVVPIVGGMYAEKQERLLKKRPEIVVGTPGRLWELMSGGDRHLVELHSLSFFVLDEADRMIESGHFHELQSIIDMLPTAAGLNEDCSRSTQNCKTVLNVQRKKRQTCVFSATISLSDDFRKKLKRGSLKPKQAMKDGLNSIEALSARAGMRAGALIVDLTNASIMADKLEESFIECNEQDKEAYLYYILSIHGQGRAIVFCTSISALRRVSSMMRILCVNVWTLHAQMQQRARLKAIDRFRGDDHAVLIATDVAARGLDIPGVRTVVHYQLPHSAEVYIHRSGRTARASADGCSVALISPNDRSKFYSLCKSLKKDSLRQFPVNNSYMPEITKRLSLARQIDKVARKQSQEHVAKNWVERNSKALELMVENSDSEEDRVHTSKQKKMTSATLQKLKQELNLRLAQPLQPKTFSRRFLAGAGVTPLLQKQLEELATQRPGGHDRSRETKRSKLIVIGQNCIEPLQALQNDGHEVCVSMDPIREKRETMENLRRKRAVDKKRVREDRRQKKKDKKNRQQQ